MTVSLATAGACLARRAERAARPHAAADAAGIGDADHCCFCCRWSCSSSAPSRNSTAPPPNSRPGAGSAAVAGLSDRARHDQLDLADRHRDRAADRLSDRLLPDDGDRQRRQDRRVCRSCCRISPASSCAPFPGWCCSASTGLVNDALLAVGLIDEPLSLMYNRLGVLIGMSYVLLPYMVLTLYAAMRGDRPVAAARRGAASARAASTRSGGCIFRSACTA